MTIGDKRQIMDKCSLNIHELFPQNIPSWVFDRVLRTPLSLYLNGFVDVGKVCFVFKDFKGVFLGCGFY